MSNCRLCSGVFFSKPLKIYKNMPSLAQNFPDEKSYKNDMGIDLVVVQCSSCGLVQLNNTPVHYYRDVIRSVAYSDEMKSFRINQFTSFIGKYHLNGKKIIEIGAGKGEYCSLLEKCNVIAYGLEHSETSVKEAQENQVKVIRGFISDPDLIIPQAPFDAFMTLNFLEHIPDICSFLKAIANKIVAGGFGIVEVPNFDMILRNHHFSEIMLDHLSYFTKETLTLALNLNGFDVLECDEIWHSYILSAVVKKRAPLNLESFIVHEKKMSILIEDFVNKFSPKSVVIWGAGHQALAIMAMFNLNKNIKFVVDSAPFKQNKFTPATHLPIMHPNQINQDEDISAVIIIGAGYSQEIAQDLQKNYRPNLSLAILDTEGFKVLK